MKQLLNTLAYLLIFTLYSSAGALRVGGSIGYYSVADSIYKDTYGSGDFIFWGFLRYDLFGRF